MKVLITGAQGMLGGHLLEAFEGGPDEAVGIDIGEADIRELDSIIRKIQEVNPDTVIHAAAMTDVDGCEKDPESAFKINTLGTHNVAVGARQAGARLFYISTDYVFDGTKEEPYNETDAVNPISIYGRSKLAGEDYVRQELAEHCIVRTAWLFGKPGRDFESWLLKQAREGKRPRIFQDQIGSPTYARDLAIKIKELMEKDASGIYHLANSGSCSRLEEARVTLKTAGLDPEIIIPISFREANLHAPRPQKTPLVSVNLDSIGVEPLRPWEEAVAEYSRAL